MKKTFKKAVLGSVITGMLLSSGVSQACTSFILKDDNKKDYVYGRTTEFGRPLEEAIILIPRNYVLKGTGNDSIPGSGINWKSKYGVVGLNIFGMPILLDGVNEKGLSGGLLNLPNSAEYQKTTKEESKNSIASYEMLTYVLTNFSTTDEVKEALPKMFVNDSPLKTWNGVVKCHMTLHDKEGKSIVVEYIGGKLVITDNPIGTMTNDPPMQWQLTNVGNYINLSPVEKPPLKVEGQTFLAPSSGSGLHGIPGDFLSPSRFLRAFEYSTSAQKYAKGVPRVELAWHIANMFDIPPGSVMIPAGDAYAGGTAGWEYTQDTVVVDSKNLDYYVRNFESINIKKFSLKDHNLDGKEIKTWQLDKSNRYEIIR